MGKYRKLFGKRRPNRKRIFIAAAAGVLVICAAGAAIVSAFGARGQTEDEEEDALAGEQERISRIYTEEYQESVQTRLDNAKNSGNYTEDAMLIEPNPYGMNSLSLYVYFKTEDAARVSYTVSVEDGDISDFSSSPASEEEYGTEHEFQVIGLVPDMENTVTFTVSYEDGSAEEYQYTEDTADTAGSEEVRLRTEDDLENASEKLENGLYVILGDDSDELDFMYYYDNDGVLRGEVPLIGYRSHRLLFRDGLMYYSISETKIAAVNSLGMAEKIYDTGTYELHHDYAFDADGNLLVLATDTEKDSVEDIVIRLDGESGEITGVLDLGELFPDYKESCSVAEDGDLDWIHINTLQYLEDETLILAGIILSKLTNVLEYDPSAEEDTSDIKIPVGDAYYSFIGNWILDYTEFSENDAGTAEQTILGLFTAGKEAAVSEILEQLNSSSASAYEDLSSDMQEYMDYVAADVLEENGILSADDADESDETYAAWTEESISLYEYLLIYDGLIHDGTISGALLCAAAYEQGVLEMNEELYNGLLSGTVSAYEWLCDRIENLEITPGQLALEPCSAGAVVTDPQTGEVLACVSYPGYDSNRLANTMDTEYYSHLVSGMNNIFYNHATQEKTAPGSTYKMVTAVAGLTEGVISSGSTIYCSGTFTKVTPSPNCWIYPGAHGSLSVVGALRESCNDFFYETGYRLGTDENGTYDSDLGIEALAKYARMFGLGETSGIEITEAEPEISDEYAVQSAIGQGTNNYTVSQLCRYVSAVANRGTVYDLSLIDKTTASDGTLIKDYGSETVSQMSEISSETWDLVQTGMEQMVSASSTFDGIDFSMAGKTGTAQQSELHPDHTLFVGYAPTDNPEIAVAVRIVNGYSSSYAAEIGRDIAKIWFDPDAAAEVLTGTAADLGGAIAGD